MHGGRDLGCGHRRGGRGRRLDRQQVLRRNRQAGLRVAPLARRARFARLACLTRFPRLTRLAGLTRLPRFARRLGRPRLACRGARAFGGGHRRVARCTFSGRQRAFGLAGVRLVAALTASAATTAATAAAAFPHFAVGDLRRDDARCGRRLLRVGRQRGLDARLLRPLRLARRLRFPRRLTALAAVAPVLAALVAAFVAPRLALTVALLRRCATCGDAAAIAPLATAAPRIARLVAALAATAAAPVAARAVALVAATAVAAAFALAIGGARGPSWAYLKNSRPLLVWQPPPLLY